MNPRNFEMPYYARKRSRTGTKKASSKTRKTTTITRVVPASSRNPTYSSAFPVAPYNGKEARTTHVYAQSLVMPGTSATLPVASRFSCNNMFDPWWSGTGHQPMGYDYMGQLFSRYLVLESWIEADFQWATSTTANASVGARCSIFRQDTSIASLILPQEVRERPAGTYATGLLAPNSREKLKLRLKFSAKEAFGLKFPDDEHDAAGIWGAGPVLQNFFAISMLGANAYTDNVAENAVICNVVMKYKVVWSRPNQLIQN